MHEPVLLKETIEGLALKAGDVLIDGTLGRAGHSVEAAKRVPGIFIIGIDRDEDALRGSEERLGSIGASFRLFLGNFKDMGLFLEKAGKEAADKILLDLGISSPQLDSSKRGFTFRFDEPLLMTMEKELAEGAFSARDVVNGWAEEDIANVIYAYGEERYARRIARAIVLAREAAPIETSMALSEIVRSSVPAVYRRGKIHPATRTFQALRIAVNDELGSLRKGLEEGMRILSPQGRMAVISFHSLEDRIVKVAFKEWQKQGLGSQSTKKPIEPTDEEKERNPRSRSSKLRVFIKN
ncbi:MAG: 16S rRNA (cytosine(1402)-N(4))-methyltransferase RsmH [Candidatus Taylorbacteria bacterium]|nr:16S rRNA (cytosine(1402)-N(4))-methyltransferase RsmH [Candidatus Taylorbacteria bacterium]